MKQACRLKLDREYPSKIVVFGGSSCATSIQAARLLEQHNLPALNLGLGAGMGAKILTRYALPALRRGDTLLVMLEPGLLTRPLQWEALGVQFSLATGQPELVNEPGGTRWPARLLDLRPGAYHAFTILGKIILRRPFYRYEPTEWQSCGWYRVTVERELPLLPVPSNRLSAEGRAWLVFLRDWCAAHGVRVAYVLPWSWCPADKVPVWQRSNAVFLHDVSLVLPVLKDPRLGAYAVREHFADTQYHPNAAGAAVRTDELAQQVKTWETWTAPELNEKRRVPD